MNDPLVVVHGSPAYQGLAALMSRHLSLPSVEAMLEVSLGRREMSPETLRLDEVADVVADTMVGLRTFCAEERLPELLQALAHYCDLEADEPPVWAATKALLS